MVASLNGSSRMNLKTKAGASAKTVGLIFCEDENDASALTSLAKGIRPDLPKIVYCRKPLILVRDKKAAEDRKKNAAGVKAVVSAHHQRGRVEFVLAHQDCDAIEPEHERLERLIRDELTEQGVPQVVPVAPAWEIEAWWFLWPAAVASVNSKWRPLVRTGNHGKVANAKEALRRALRSNSTPRDYEESDSRRIAEAVVSLKIIDKRTGSSESFNSFQQAVAAIKV